jgi:hypothetical protein
MPEKFSLQVALREGQGLSNKPNVFFSFTKEEYEIFQDMSKVMSIMKNGFRKIKFSGPCLPHMSVFSWGTKRTSLF